ncbi:hypothetical protein BD309DRAFT_441776 [Dichomitus squalens]|nr:hypothetical protein BD309DRAFT_441776 [Dichomitus squalens]
MSKAEPENKPEAVQVGAESSDGATLENIEQRKVDKVSERAHDGQERQALESTGEVLDHGEESARKGSGRAPECHASPLSKRSENIEGNERHNPEAHQDQDGEQLESAHGGEEDIVRTLEDALSSPESEWPISPTSSGLSPSRPIIFGSITLEYLNSLWEKEGPEALVNTGVWAKQVLIAFVLLFLPAY